MSAERPEYRKFSYDQNARNRAPDDFHGQCLRTIDGKPVPKEQIEMVIAKIKSDLGLSLRDHLLELPCGNGWLSQFLFESCRGYLGIDVSEYLVSIAQLNFQKLPDYRFQVGRAPQCLFQEKTPEVYTKLLMYAGIQYFPDSEALELLTCVRDRFVNIRTVLICNVPDRDRSANFYKSSCPSEQELNDPETAIGMWRTKSGVRKLAKHTGWDVRLTEMPPEFYASSYRFDALLTRE